MAKAGKAKPVYRVSDGQLSGNGGNIKIVGNVASRAKFVDDEVAVSGKPQPVYIVTDADLVENGGPFKLRGGEPLKLKTIAGEPIRHGEAIPIYDIDPAVPVGPVIPMDNLEIWLLSDSGLFQQSDGTVPATADNDVVGYWEDEDEQDNPVTQSTTSRKPVLINGVVGGLPIVRYDLTDDVLTNATTAELFTVFVVAANASAGFPAGSHVLFTQDDSSFQLLQTSGGGGLVRMLSGAFAINDPTAWGTSFKIATVTAAAGDLRFYINGSLLGTAAGFTAHSGTLSIGNHPSLSQGWGGDIAEFIGYSTVLGDDDLNTIGNYLADRYGISWSDI